MNWQDPSKYAQVSTDGAYSICAIRTEGGPFYEAWRTRQHPEGPGMIQTGIQTAEFARKLCEEAADPRAPARGDRP